MGLSGLGKLIKELATGTPADTDCFVFGNSDMKKITLPNLKKALGITKNEQDIKTLNSSLIDFINVEALHTEIITEAKSYTLDKSIADYKLIEIIIQYGSTNWIATRFFRPSTLSQFPNVMDSTKTSMLECYYNMYISNKRVNVGAISKNTRILIRGIK